jgi:hypothetical protein
MSWKPNDEADEAHAIMEKIAAGDAALRVLNDPVIQAAFSELEELYTEQLLRVEATDHDERWALVCKVTALRNVRNIMTRAVTTAKQAEKRRRKPQD